MQSSRVAAKCRGQAFRLLRLQKTEAADVAAASETELYGSHGLHAYVHLDL